MKKYISKILLMISVIFGLTTISSVKYDPRLEGVKIKTYALDAHIKDGFQIILGQNIDLSVNYFPKYASSKKLIWSSSDDSVLSVDEKGKVTSKGIGEATIKVQADKKSAEFKIEVLPVYVSSISLSYTYEEIAIGQTGKIQVRVYPSTATDTSISWISETPNLISIDQEGNFTALAAGYGIIKVSSNDGNTSSTIGFDIKNEIYPDTIKINENSQGYDFISVSDTEKLSVWFTPSNTTVKDLTWSSSDESIASIDENGYVTGLKQGEVTITATATNGASDTINLTVYRRWFFNIKTSSGDGFILTSTIGEQVQLKAYYSPDNSLFDKPITWSSNNKNVAEVDENGLVTIVGYGNAAIFAKSYDYQTWINITVSEN